MAAARSQRLQSVRNVLLWSDASLSEFPTPLLVLLLFLPLFFWKFLEASQHGLEGKMCSLQQVVPWERPRPGLEFLLCHQ